MTQSADGAVYGHDRDAHASIQSSPAPPRTVEDQYPAAATAAVALAQLHSHQPHSEWDSEPVSTLSEAVAPPSQPRMANNSRLALGLRLRE